MLLLNLKGSLRGGNLCCLFSKFFIIFFLTVLIRVYSVLHISLAIILVGQFLGFGFMIF